MFLIRIINLKKQDGVFSSTLEYHPKVARTFYL